MLKLRTHDEMMKEFALRIVKTGQEKRDKNLPCYISEDTTFRLTFIPIRYTGVKWYVIDEIACFYLPNSAEPDFYALRSELMGV